MLRVKRNTGMSGILGKITIHVNDKKVATIKQNQQIEINLPTDEAKIFVTQGSSHSNELVVKAGQVVKITNSIWNRISVLFVFFAIFSVSSLLPHNYKIFGFIIVFMVSYALTYFKNSFELTVIYP